MTSRCIALHLKRSMINVCTIATQQTQHREPHLVRCHCHCVSSCFRVFFWVYFIAWFKYSDHLIPHDDKNPCIAGQPIHSPAVCRNPSEAHRLSQISRWESHIHAEMVPPTASGTLWRWCWIALLKYYCLMIFHTSRNTAIQYWLSMSRPLLLFVFASFLGSSLSSAPAFHLASFPLHFAAPYCPLLHPTFECGKPGVKTN